MAAVSIYLLKFAEVKAFLFQPQLCRTFYSNNLHNIVGSVLSVNLNGAIWWNLELNEYFTGASFAKIGITYKKFLL